MSRRLYALNPITGGTFWEITAVPEIRRQSASLARQLPGRPTHSTAPDFKGFLGEARAFAAVEPHRRLER